MQNEKQEHEGSHLVSPQHFGGGEVFAKPLKGKEWKGLPFLSPTECF